jgi:hypothetical protein
MSGVRECVVFLVISLVVITVLVLGSALCFYSVCFCYLNTMICSSGEKGLVGNKFIYIRDLTPSFQFTQFLAK